MKMAAASEEDSATNRTPEIRRKERAVDTLSFEVWSETLVTMTNLDLKGRWNELKGKLKQKYGQLTDDDLTFAEGKEEELLGRLQQRLGRSKEDMRRELEEL
jgi:uncharacterized protein YjbJ (UPF0337 family)